jgi:hypothetical protein
MLHTLSSLAMHYIEQFTFVLAFTLVVAPGYEPSH